MISGEGLKWNNIMWFQVQGFNIYKRRVMVMGYNGNHLE